MCLFAERELGCERSEQVRDWVTRDKAFAEAHTRKNLIANPIPNLTYTRIRVRDTVGDKVRVGNKTISIRVRNMKKKKKRRENVRSILVVFAFAAVLIAKAGESHSKINVIVLRSVRLRLLVALVAKT